MATRSGAMAARPGEVAVGRPALTWRQKLSWKTLNWQHLFWCTLLGLVVLTFNLDAFLRHLGSHSLSESWTGSLARELGEAPSRLVVPTLDLVQRTEVQVSAFALTGTLVLVEIYFVLVILHAVRRRGFRIIAAGVAGIVGGVVFLPVAIWTLVGVISLFRIALLPVLYLIADGILAVIDFLDRLLEFVLALSVIEGLLIALLGIVVAALYTRMAAFLPLAVIWMLLANALMLAGLLPIFMFVLRGLRWLAHQFAQLMAAIWDVIAPAFAWLIPIILTLSHWISVVAEFLGPIAMRLLVWLGVLVLAILITLVASAILAGLMLMLFALPGALVIDQFRVAWHSGGGRAAVFNSSFSLGLTIALVLIVSGGNSELLRMYDESLEAIWRVPEPWDVSGSLASFWPASMEREILPFLSATQAPLFDAVLLLAAAATSCIGILAIWRLPTAAANSRYELIFPTIVFAVLGAVVSILLAALFLALNSIGGGDA